MKVKFYFKVFILISLQLNASGCGSSVSTAPAGLPTDPTHYTPVMSGPNVLPVQVGGLATCGHSGYFNEPCTSVKICVPGTTNCQTITDLLVDTGSTGLRIFASVLTLPLQAVTDSFQNQIAECAQFGTGTDWGPLVIGQVFMASEPGVQTSIQLINHSYGSVPPQCSSSDTTPQKAGFNGILGLGLFKYDCGTFCTTTKSNQIYFGCNGTTCTSETVPLLKQLQNPVALLPTDNNGIIFELPLISETGSSIVSGSVVLGIGTQDNNNPAGATRYATDSQGNFTTTFNGKAYSGSFIDSGSNGLFFSGSSSLSLCPSSNLVIGFFCPNAPLYFTATNRSSSGDAQAGINFQIENAEKLASTGNSAFTNLGGEYSASFDWGLPFFYGRKVYVGIDSTSSPLGVGPYWGY